MKKILKRLFAKRVECYKEELKEIQAKIIKYAEVMDNAAAYEMYEVVDAWDGRLLSLKQRQLKLMKFVKQWEANK